MQRHRRTAGFLRLIAIWLINTFALYLLVRIMPGVHTSGYLCDGNPCQGGLPLSTALAIAVLNALLWPLFIRFLLPLGVVTLGLAPLLLNGVIVYVAARWQGEFEVDTVFHALLLAFGVTVINTVVTTVLGLDDIDFYYRRSMRRRARRLRGKNAKNTEVPGVVFLEVDGLAHEVLRRAMRDGNAATASSWQRNGHRLMAWECDWSSQTSGCQAGLLHGNNHDIPAFRWWDKERGAALVSNHPVDAMALERRLSDGKGLLAFGGASRSNLLSGDAPHTLLTLSTVLKKRGKTGEDYYAYFANPHNVTRTLMQAVADIGIELWTSAQQRRRDMWPRIHRTLGYAVARAYTTVVQRDLQVGAVVFDILMGRPVVYTTFLGYDEVAHHSGLERMSAIWVLRGIDRQFARIERAVRDAPRPYHFVVLADHGQSQGATFRQRYGRTLEDLVGELTGASSLESQKQGTEGPSFLQASVAEVAKGRGPQAGIARLFGGLRHYRREPGKPPEVVVMASGCLGLISFPREPGRLTLERIEMLYPRLVEGLRQHPGIGFLLVRSEKYGALAVGAEGVRYLDHDRVEGHDPLEPFGPNAAAKVRRTDSFEHCPDIVLNGTYWKEDDEVAAFEELVGSHGGMGGSQAYPFVLYPGSWSEPAEPIVGAEAMHRQLRRWLVELGQTEHAEPLLERSADHGHELETREVSEVTSDRPAQLVATPPRPAFSGGGGSSGDGRAGPELDVLVIGAGQAGLATAYHLRETGLRYGVVDAHSRVGDSWRQRYDSLVLFTPGSYSALPGLAVPGDPDGYPTKDEIADYLESYARHFALPIRLNAGVRSLDGADGRFRAAITDDSTIQARTVVIAAGAFQAPRIPALSAAFSPEVCQVTAASYRNPSQVPAGTVLVAGDGATGRQIALELAATHKVLLATGRPRRVTPDRVLGRSIFWWLDHLGLLRATRKSRVGRRMMAGDPFPGRGLALPRLRKAGLKIVPRLAAADGKTVRFADGGAAEIGAVVWATGYRDDSQWVGMPAAKSAEGSFVQSRGISPVPGLYFVGQSWQWTRGSALLTGVGADAAYVTAQIARTLATGPPL